MPHMLNIFNYEFARRLFSGLLIKDNIGFKLFNYFDNSSIFYNSYTEQPFAYFKYDIAQLK